MKIDFIKDNKGATAVIVAVTLVVLLLLASFVLDFGTAYAKAGQMQNAVDSAALAAASQLPINLGDSSKQNAATSLAHSYASKNGITISKVEFIESNGYYNGVRVSAKVDVETFIAKIIGIKNISVGKKATAKATPSIAVTNMVPLSIKKEDLLEAKQTGNTKHLELKVSAPGHNVEKGAFGALELDGNKGGGAKDFRYYVANGYPGQLKIGDILPIKAGNMSGPTMQGFEQRYNACTHNQSTGGCSINDYVEGCPRIVIAPVVTYTKPHEVVIEGFAAFILEECPGPGNKNKILGSFLEDVHVVGTGSQNGSGQNDFGVYSICLVE